LTPEFLLPILIPVEISKYFISIIFKNRNIYLKYRIEFSPDVEEHLRFFSKNQQTIVFDEIEKQLAVQPTIQTRNRKLMRPNPFSPWELRIGNMRVYYDVEESPEPVVYIRAIGIKHRNIVKIGKEVFIL